MCVGGSKHLPGTFSAKFKSVVWSVQVSQLPVQNVCKSFLFVLDTMKMFYFSCSSEPQLGSSSVPGAAGTCYLKDH